METIVHLIVFLLLFTEPESCVAVAGDSVAQGGVVFEVPGQGFPVVQTWPLAELLVEADIDARDYSAGAAHLTPYGRRPYIDTAEYHDLLDDECDTLVVTPWVNDLALTTPERHVDDLSALFEVVPHEQILLFTYYPVDPPAFKDDIDPADVDLFNEAILAACDTWEYVTCVETETLFADLLDENAHVITEVTADELDAMTFEPPEPPESDYLRVFFAANPDGVVIGDGVHLSPAAKALMVNFIVNPGEASDG
jgi:hypothetical protein